MYDDIVRMLIEVRHAFDLRNNLISLGVLAYATYQCIFQGGVMKVMKGILVTMKDKVFGNLYKHEGRTKIDHARIRSKGSSESTRLWINAWVIRVTKGWRY